MTNDICDRDSAKTIVTSARPEILPNLIQYSRALCFRDLSLDTGGRRIVMSDKCLLCRLCYVTAGDIMKINCGGF
jgi:hypothetical protein